MGNVLTLTLDEFKDRIPEENREELYEMFINSKSQFELYMNAMNNAVQLTSEEAAALMSQITRLNGDA